MNPYSQIGDHVIAAFRRKGLTFEFADAKATFPDEDFVTTAHLSNGADSVYFTMTSGNLDSALWETDLLGQRLKFGARMREDSRNVMNRDELIDIIRAALSDADSSSERKAGCRVVPVEIWCETPSAAEAWMQHAADQVEGVAECAPKYNGIYADLPDFKIDASPRESWAQLTIKTECSEPELLERLQLRPVTSAPLKVCRTFELKADTRQAFKVDRVHAIFRTV